LTYIDGDPIKDIFGRRLLEGLSYHGFSKWLQDRLKYNCRNKDHANWGPHTPMRTFYLFATLGGGLFQDIIRNARHRDLDTAKAYHEDAKALCKKLFDNPELSHHITKFGLSRIGCWSIMVTT
jgi:hypothetical protein